MLTFFALIFLSSQYAELTLAQCFSNSGTRFGPSRYTSQQPQGGAKGDFQI